MSKIIIGGHKVTAQADYSTTETKTGEYWIDGKPIYRKVIPFTSTSGSSNVSTTGCNINILVSSSVFFKNANSSDCCVAPYYSSSADNFGYYLHSSKEYLVLRSGTSYGFGTGYMIIEYTKTTD